MAGLTYWSLERLEHLRTILEEMSKAQTNTHLRVIETNGSIKWPVSDAFKKKYPDADSDQVGTGLSLFVKMGILDEGRKGSRKSSSKRHFNPNVKITQAAVDDGYHRMKNALPPKQHNT